MVQSEMHRTEMKDAARWGDQWCLRLFQRIGEAWLKVFRQKGDVGKPFAQSAGKEKSENRSALYTLNEKVA